MSDAESGDESSESATPTTAERACFEAGIKFGSLYHQFAGTPVSPESAASLADAMEVAIENQPHCREVRVDIDETALESALADGTVDYTELTGRFMTVDIVVGVDEVTVETSMSLEDGYPLMRIDAVRR